MTSTKFIQNYLEAQVDIVSLDRDQEEFKEELSQVFTFQEGYHEYGEAIFISFNIVYKRIEIVNKDLGDLMNNNMGG